MPNPNASGGDLSSITLSEVSPLIADFVTQTTAFLDQLSKVGSTKPAKGGLDYKFPVTYQDTGTFTYFRGLQQLNVDKRETITHFVYDLAQCAVTLVHSDLEQIINSGEQQVADLVKSRIKTAKAEMRNNIGGSNGVYGDGSVLNSPIGLPGLISTTPTVGVIGGVDRSLYPVARNFVYRAVTDGGAAKSAANIKDYDNRILVATSRNGDGPNLIVCDNEDFLLRQKVANSMQVLVNEKKPTIGYREFLGPDGIPVVCDGGFGGDCPANTSYFIDTRHFFYRPIASRNMHFLPTRSPERQIGEIQYLVHYYAMCVDMFAFHAVLTNT